ncbi:MAG: YihY/virulence factor BrkB family protein, partial [Actinomycetota bacterium]|nr:YihY/virulence factor BrkB family protein [Actinomycetota bacterium]
MTPDAPDWEGQTMLDRAGKKIGTIEEIYLVEETGRPEWALVSVSRRRTTLVPLAGARPGAEGIRAAYDKKTIDDAPGVAGEPSQRQVTQTYRHYGIDYDDNGQTEAPNEAQRSASQQRAKQRPQGGSRGATSSRAARNQSGGSMLKRVVKEFSADDLTHWAAALTYYAILSIFPALLAIVSILGLIGSSAIQPLIDNLSTVAPGPAKEILTGALQGLQ